MPLQEHYKKVIVMHHTKIRANCNLSTIVRMEGMEAGHHNLEEGDQLVLLNAIDIKHREQETKVDVFSLDTDVFVLLTGSYHQLPPLASLLRKKGDKISIRECYMKLGKKRANALIGWYAFKGTDNTGAFAGKVVASHLKALLQ